ncbi:MULTISPECIES: PRD domain-containing protein [unclassified Exiguobacterium]|uniref:PRD domain-containing protein n=1 Tax=Exiguobacterium sp. s80 TaxID=2751209 RepID=UPI000B58F96D|nr:MULTISPECIES: PRD domain-containing protein [unclassified Exiguobacterium]ASI36693.1 transcription antiterminator BglG [Exiguobacterium sp. N4-1P]
MIIHKVLNNNAIVTKEQGQERIIMGPGIAFGKKKKDPVDPSKIEKMFIPSFENAELFKEILTTTPLEIIDLSEQIISYAEGELQTPFHDYIHVSLTDHLAHAVRLARENLVVHNRLAEEIRLLYTAEYKIGAWAVAQIEQTLAVVLPKEEAANIALHLFNARQQHPNMATALQTATLLNELREQIESFFGQTIETTSMTYYRFFTHMKLVLARIEQGQTLHDMDDVILSAVKTRYADAFRCAESMAAWLEQELKTTVPDSEVGYMALHVERIRPDLERSEL